MLRLRKSAKPSIALLALVAIVPADAIAVTCYKIHDRNGRLVYRAPQAPIDTAGNMGKQMRDRWHGGSLSWTESPFCDPLEDGPAIVQAPSPTTTVAAAVTAQPAASAVSTATNPAAMSSAPPTPQPPTNPVVAPPAASNSAQSLPEAITEHAPDTPSSGSDAQASNTFTPATSKSAGSNERRAYAALPSTAVSAPEPNPIAPDQGTKGRSVAGKSPPADALAPAARGRAVEAAPDSSSAVSLAWSNGAHAWTAGFTSVRRSGAYDVSRYSNTGLGLGIVDAGYTYRGDGRAFSATLAASYNAGPNADPIYRKGVGSRLDWAWGESVDSNWQIGLSGYVNYQLAAESGSIMMISPAKPKVAALGPQVGYAFAIGGVPVYANLTSFREVWSPDGAQGYGFRATVDIPLSWRSRE